MRKRRPIIRSREAPFFIWCLLCEEDTLSPLLKVRLCNHGLETRLSSLRCASENDAPKTPWSCGVARRLVGAICEKELGQIQLVAATFLRPKMWWLETSPLKYITAHWDTLKLPWLSERLRTQNKSGFKKFSTVPTCFQTSARGWIQKTWSQRCFEGIHYVI